MEARVWVLAIVFLVSWGLASADSARDPRAPDVCLRETLMDAVLGFPGSACVIGGRENVDHFIDVTEGDEVSLQRALNMFHKSGYEYIAVLFYASWCPFSKNCRPAFSILSSLYPSFPHLAIKESAVRPSVLTKYGVHGFPTLVLLNSTMRIRYHGSRTLGSLIAFYRDVTGIETAPLNQSLLEKTGQSLNLDVQNHIEPENCPFPWARYPENLLGQDTYLGLATAFVLLRLMYYTLPVLMACLQGSWRRHIQSLCLWDHPLVYLNRPIQIFRSLREPCKKSNLQGGARAWASKSLASVSIGEASSSRGSSVGAGC